MVQNRPHYVQKVSVPLDVLYAGENIELELKASIFERCKAAYTGGLLTPVLLQAALTVAMNWLRSQRVNWFLSLVMFVAIVYIHIPPPPDKVIYSTTIRKGWKAGTKIKYKSNEAADITFIIQEENHDAFRRVDDDLHTSVEVSPRQLRKGCTLTINPLCDDEEPIKLKLRPREIKNGQIVTVKSRGWPKAGGKEQHGDLKVKICVGYDGVLQEAQIS